MGFEHGFINVRRLSSAEPLIGLDNVSVGDFWAWAYSDLVCNVNRSTLAEFIIGSVLGVTDGHRLEWDSVDLRYKGKGIEVKSTAYVQSWPQTRLSDIRFDISIRKEIWDITINKNVPVTARTSDCYVFCLFLGNSVEEMNVLDASRIEFYVLPTPVINEKFGNQGSLGIKRLQEVCQPVNHEGLKEAIECAIGIAEK